VFFMEDVEQSLAHGEPRLARSLKHTDRIRTNPSLRPASRLPRVRFLLMLGSLSLICEKVAVIFG